MMINEHDLVVLNRDLSDRGLVAGDVGVVVHVYDGGKGYEVEFMRYDGTTIGVATLRDDDIRVAGVRDVPHVRELAA